jgi:hypothetical protein
VQGHVTTERALALYLREQVRQVEREGR